MLYDEVVKEIMEANHNCALSGSAALKLQGFNIRREPKDIDIYLPEGFWFKEVVGMQNTTDEMYEGQEDERTDYEYQGYKINVFTSNDFKDFDVYKGIKVVKWQEIIKFKVMHSLSTSTSNMKHKLDLIHFIANN